ncbi:zinc-binding loop region of homing endonuclease [Lipomyces kononenkoae]|uniref:Zinc-binding loop region of homing endonuclease n=1 Tax=Lipomyces kononenkoae TaxID=34357 RepID=A0ACC3SZD0_LIPKO
MLGVGNQNTHHRGYASVHLVIGRRSYCICLHQIVLVADDRREELNQTLRSDSHDISHLCHNRKCFNPEHLVVESRLNNRRRQRCNVATDTKF